jgi:Concanavalin A-like lectin/glucanases superfamily
VVKLAWLMVGACGFAPAAATDAAAPDRPPIEIDAALHYRKKITLAVHSPTPLTDFPVSIVTTDPDLAGHATRSNIGMTLLDGTPLALEIVAFDPPTGALEAWVRLPAVTDTLDIYMTYGAATQAVSASVWSPDIFAAAWHLSETGAGAWLDTAGGHTVTPTSPETTAATTQMGIVGAARSFDGIDDTSPGPDSPELTFDMRSFSVQVWVNVTQSADQYDMVIDKGGDTNMPGYCLTLGTDNWLVEAGDNNYVIAPFGVETHLLGHWNQLTAVIDRTQNVIKAYANGILTGSVSLAGHGSLASTHAFEIGSSTLEHRFQGIVDEVRVFVVPLTTEWIAAEYRNSTQRQAFVTFGDEERL